MPKKESSSETESTKRLAHILSLPRGRGMIGDGWPGTLWYRDAADNLCRFNWNDLTPEIVIRAATWPGIRGLPTDCRGQPAWPGGGCVTPDQRRLFYVARLAGGRPTLLCLDLRPR